MGLKVIICYQSQYNTDIKTEKNVYIFFFYVINNNMKEWACVLLRMWQFNVLKYLNQPFFSFFEIKFKYGSKIDEYCSMI